MIRFSLVSSIAIVGCYAPTAQPGLPCSAEGECPSGQRCVAGTCEGPDLPGYDAPPLLPDAATVDATPPPNPRVFVTSEAFTGNLGGRDGANALCNDAAIAGGLVGDFGALLGFEGTARNSGLEESMGWVNLSGDRIAATAEAWVTNILNPLRFDENGINIGRERMWLGDATQHCDNWTSGAVDQYANIGYASDALPQNSLLSCNGAAHLICLEKGAAPLPPIAGDGTGWHVFLSSTRWKPQDGGIASADALCQSDADAVGLAGNYKAILADASGDPFARFSFTPKRLIRADGEIVATDAAQLIAGAILPMSFVSVKANFLADQSTSQHVWLGTTSNCTNWTIADSQFARGALATRGDRFMAYDNIDFGCTNTLNVVCIEQP